MVVMVMVVVVVLGLYSPHTTPKIGENSLKISQPKMI
jgi:hypothetical protein